MLKIRDAERQDAALILAFVRELAEYEREPEAVLATEEDFARDGFGPAPLFRAVIAEWDGAPVGFALYCTLFSTWRGRGTLYLEDLFVRPAHRGKRIGLALMKHLAREARRRECARFAWNVLDWNEPSIRFYESLGAKVLRDWLTVRMDGEALERLAAAE